jgi:hypothetical protein
MNVIYGRQVSPVTTLGSTEINYMVTSDTYIVLDQVQGLEIDYKTVGSVKIGDQWFARVNNPADAEALEANTKTGPVRRLT